MIKGTLYPFSSGSTCLGGEHSSGQDPEWDSLLDACNLEDHVCLYSSLGLYHFALCMAHGEPL